MLSVLLYHADVPGFDGGFLGVDVFFVISGYLITSIVVSDLDNNRFSLMQFYLRRVRRIFPTLISVNFAMFFIGAYVYDSRAYNELSKSIVSATVFCSNFFFWQQSGYFDSSSLFKPMLHTWSLSVEEQFYIIFPVSLLLARRLSKSNLVVLLTIGFALSLGLYSYSITTFPSASFYFLFTRAWEILAGSILAVSSVGRTISCGVKDSLTFLGLLLIMFSVHFFTEAVGLNVLTNLLPVLGAVLVIVGGIGGAGRVAQSVLTRPTMTFIGRISYSLYLWHWPVVALRRYICSDSLNAIDSIQIIALSTLLAFLSWQYIEVNFRHGSAKSSIVPKRFFYLTATACGAVLIAGIAISLNNGLPFRFSFLKPDIAETMNNVYCDSLFPDNVRKYLNEQQGPLWVGSSERLPTIALMGDSHARSITPGLAKWATMNSASCLVFAASGAPPLTDVEIHYQSNDDHFSEAIYSDNVIDAILSTPAIHTVVLVARWSVYLGHSSGSKKGQTNGLKLVERGDNHQYKASTQLIFSSGLKKTITRLTRAGRKVVIVKEAPNFKNDIPTEFYRTARWPALNSTQFNAVNLKRYRESRYPVNSLLDELAKSCNAKVIGMEHLLFNSDGTALTALNGQLLYVDDNHLSTAGAEHIVSIFDGAIVTDR